MVDFFEELPNGDFNAQFFANLALETGLKGFARLAFASGKLPESAQVGLGMALGDEEF